jgi:hypothetical protein
MMRVGSRIARAADAAKRTGFRSLALLLTASVPGCVGAMDDRKTDEVFRVVVGASSASDIRPCSDYAAHRSYTGQPYYVRVPETGKVTTRHEGVDFCGHAGSEVLAAANGVVASVVQDNPHRGGRVTIRTAIEYDHYGRGRTTNVFLDALHITPRAGLAAGDRVRAGEVIGTMQRPGKAEIGPISHVHLSAGPVPQTWAVHTDPNRFWQKGPGIVSCFDAGKPPTDLQIVAPVRC